MFEYSLLEYPSDFTPTWKVSAKMNDYRRLSITDIEPNARIWKGNFQWQNLVNKHKQVSSKVCRMSDSLSPCCQTTTDVFGSRRKKKQNEKIVQNKGGLQEKL